MRTMIRRREKITRRRAQFAIAIGILLFIYPAVTGIRSFRVLWYRRVQGSVLSTRLQSTVAGRMNLHRPVIEYSYVVGNVTYRNNLYDSFNGDGTETWAREILQHYQAGAVCSVFYHPTDPQKSVLSRAPNYNTIWITIDFSVLGVILVVGGMLAVRRFGRLEVPPAPL